jgi:hypothetical protein
MTNSDSPQLYLPAQNEYVPTGGPSGRRDLPLEGEIERYSEIYFVTHHVLFPRG